MHRRGAHELGASDSDSPRHCLPIPSARFIPLAGISSVPERLKLPLPDAPIGERLCPALSQSSSQVEA